VLAGIGRAPTVSSANASPLRQLFVLMPYDAHISIDSYQSQRRRPRLIRRLLKGDNSALAGPQDAFGHAAFLELKQACAVSRWFFNFAAFLAEKRPRNPCRQLE
jgi:hypothetical protein